MNNTLPPEMPSQDEIANIAASGLFELDFYSQVAGIKFASLEQAIQHFYQQGVASQLNPGRFFDTGWYLATNADVARARINPLLHFINFGHAEGRGARPALRCETLQQVDKLTNDGSVAQAKTLLNSITPTSALMVDAIELRQLRFEYYGAEPEQGFARMAKLQAVWHHFTHPTECRELMKIKVYWLHELGQTVQARAELEAEIARYAGWSSYLEWYKDFVEAPAQLNYYQQMLAPFMAKENYASAQALLSYAIAAKRVSAYQQAFDALEQRWYILQKLRVKHANANKSAGRNWSALAAAALKSLKAALAAQQQPFFLISGTLLGCIRDNAILPHDKDIDVGVFEGADLPQIAKGLRQSGCFLIQHQRHPKVLQVRHINGVLIDIFVHWQEGEWCFHAGQKTRWQNSAFSLKPVSFLGEEFLIPDPAPVYLTENYGNWHQPKVDYDTFTDTPNMEITDLHDVQFHYLKVLPEHLLRGNIASFKKIWAVYQKKFQPNWRMKRAYVAVIAGSGLRRVFARRSSH